MLRRLLTPRWITAHLVVLTVAVVFVRLGIWQLDRLEERRASNAVIAERRDAAPAPLETLLAEAPTYEEVRDDFQYRQTSATGVFDTAEEVLVRSRTNQGEAGYHVVTPLVTAPGAAVLVNRGWVPLSMDTPPVAAPPPAGPVQVSGLVRSSQEAPALGPTDPSGGVLTRVYWIDIPRLQKQSAYALAPLFIDLRSMSPSQAGSLPILTEDVVIDEGSHLAYAIQWFSFTLIGLAGYAAILRRSFRKETGGRSRVY